MQPSEATQRISCCCEEAAIGSVSVTFLYCVETAKDTAIVTMECEYGTVRYDTIVCI